MSFIGKKPGYKLFSKPSRNGSRGTARPSSEVVASEGSATTINASFHDDAGGSSSSESVQSWPGMAHDGADMRRGSVGAEPSGQTEPLRGGSSGVVALSGQQQSVADGTAPQRRDLAILGRSSSTVVRGSSVVSRPFGSGASEAWSGAAPPRRAAILLGPVGSGKSTLVNDIRAAVTGAPSRYKTAPVGVAAARFGLRDTVDISPLPCTTKLTAYRFTSSAHQPSTPAGGAPAADQSLMPYLLVDTPGYSAGEGSEVSASTATQLRELVGRACMLVRAVGQQGCAQPHAADTAAPVLVFSATQLLHQSMPDAVIDSAAGISCDLSWSTADAAVEQVGSSRTDGWLNAVARPLGGQWINAANSFVPGVLVGLCAMSSVISSVMLVLRGRSTRQVPALLSGPTSTEQHAARGKPPNQSMGGGPRHPGHVVFRPKVATLRTIAEFAVAIRQDSMVPVVVVTGLDQYPSSYVSGLTVLLRRALSAAGVAENRIMFVDSHITTFTDSSEVANAIESSNYKQLLALHNFLLCELYD